ncbi:MAG: DUF4350 domain-containing protein [Planctomycetota bacterium]|jgi:hypothetical protein
MDDAATPTTPTANLRWTMILSVLAALAAAWIAAGSVGLLAYPLKRTLLWLCLAVALFCDPASLRATPARLMALVAAVCVAVWMTASPLVPVQVCAVALVLLAMCLLRAAPVRLAAAQAVAVFAVYQLLLHSVPAVWLVADRVGMVLGMVPAAVIGRPLWVGATFGGVDFLVLTGALAFLWFRRGEAKGWRRGAIAAGVILAVHFGYLLVLVFAAYLERLFPTVWPWNLPVVGALLHLVLIGVVLRWHGEGLQVGPTRSTRRMAWATVALAVVLPAVVTLPLGTSSLDGKKVVVHEKCYGNWDRPKHGEYGRLSIGMYGMLDPFVRSLGGEFLLSKQLSEEDLRDADVLILLYPYEPWGGISTASLQVNGTPGKGATTMNLDAALVAGTLAPGDTFVIAGDTQHYTITNTTKASLNTFTSVTFVPGLAAAPADNTSVTVSLDDPLARIERFVQEGGSLLLLGEHTVKAEIGEKEVTKEVVKAGKKVVEKAIEQVHDDDSRFNDVLKPTSMQVRFDSGTFEIGGWLQSYHVMAHPATAGVGDERNEFGVVIGASMAVSFPARPLLIGKWGWADPGDEAGEAMMGNGRYDAGEKLGDLVLAAEQPLGKGTIVAFGDTSSMTNGITMGSHVFTSRLLGYLGNRPGSPQAGWRQLLGVLVGGALVLLVMLGVSAPLLCGATVTLAAVLAMSTAISHRAGELVPDGRSKTGGTGNYLAYVDSTHMGRFDDESWRLDGTMGLKMMLVRNGYMALELQEFTRERLDGAGLLVSIAPSRNFSAAECEAVRDFVVGGGIFILTTSYHDRAGSRELLETFGFEIGKIDTTPDREPQPMGHFKAPYYNGGDYFAFVRFHEAWPISCTAADAPPADWTQQEAFDEWTVQRFTGWFLGQTLAPVFPWLQKTHPARVLAYGTGNHPTMLMRRIGKGAVVVVGDSAFALNKNLEIESGAAFEGMRENPDFWRWLLTDLWEQEAWIPPRPTQKKK